MKLKPAVQISRRIAEIGREAWDACAGHPDHRGNPFVAFDFLDIAEAAGCAVERTGWGPQHLSVEDEAGQIAAVMPLFHIGGLAIFTLPALMFGGTAVIVEALTDNRNRTASVVRSIFTKAGGALGETGSVGFMFDRLGEISYPLSAGSNDAVLEAAIEAGADDVES